MISTGDENPEAKLCKPIVWAKDLEKRKQVNKSIIFFIVGWFLVKLKIKTL